MNATVVFDTSISLDGYMTAGGRTADEPLGVGGEQLHEWTHDTEYLDEQIAALGAVIVGGERMALPGRRGDRSSS